MTRKAHRVRLVDAQGEWLETSYGCSCTRKDHETEVAESKSQAFRFAMNHWFTTSEQNLTRIRKRKAQG
jgi:hypothetical protein